MQYLCIDFGLKKIGLAISDGSIAEPYGVYRFKDVDRAIAMIKNLVSKNGITNIVIGISEGKMSTLTKEFSSILEKEVLIKPTFWDETLSTLEAQSYSIEANINRKKRKSMEDAYAATLILQSYLDSLNSK